MNHIRGSDRQYCPDQSHDGRPKTSRLHEAPRSRAFWPTGWKSFEEAVRVYRESNNPVELPDIDLGGFDL